MPPPVASFDISVVVPTYNREALVTETLESLVRQDAKGVRYEVIVVDNGSTDNTRTAIEPFLRASSDLRYVLEPLRGVSHARNTGARLARAPLIAFIDDDVAAAPDWVATIAGAFAAHPAVDCLGGEIIAQWSAPPPSWLTSQFWGPLALQTAIRPERFVDAERATACLMTANFACRRTALEAVGGFDPGFLRDEDRELQLRLWGAGKRGMFVPEMRVIAGVPSERLSKPYHRAFYLRAGASHARMRYLERVDRHGRLLASPAAGVRVFGAPGFIYRHFLAQVAAWLQATLRGDWDAAFYHETRALYFASYAWRHGREWTGRWWTAPLELLRAIRMLARRLSHGAAPQE
jgi:glycosyltransferase involved in cell wall biosynthesis